MANLLKKECILGCGAIFNPNKEDETSKSLIRKYFPNVDILPESGPTEEEHHMVSHGFMRYRKDNSSKVADSWICVSEVDGYQFGDYAERRKNPVLVPASIYGSQQPRRITISTVYDSSATCP